MLLVDGEGYNGGSMLWIAEILAVIPRTVTRVANLTSGVSKC